MKASIFDLPYKIKEILAALERNEQIQIVYHGKLKGILTPAGKKTAKKIKEHEFFGSASGDKRTVENEMTAQRGGRI